MTAYARDLGGKLAGIDASGTADDASYAYDALGRIASRTVNSVTDAYSYAGASAEAVRITTGGVNLDSAVGATGDRIAAASGSSYNWFLPDLHGSVAGSLSADQSTVTSATRYDAWGGTAAAYTAPGGAVGSAAWRYQGRLDVGPAGLGTPLYAMGARLYSPGVGAFTSLDTVAGSAQSPLSMNRFLYAQADPATLVDPTGHSVIDVDGYGSTLTIDQWHKPSTHHKIVLASASRLRAAGQAEVRLKAERNWQVAHPSTLAGPADDLGAALLTATGRVTGAISFVANGVALGAAVTGQEEIAVPAEGVAKVSGIISALTTCLGQGPGVDCGLAAASTALGAGGSAAGLLARGGRLAPADAEAVQFAIRSQVLFGILAVDSTAQLYVVGDTLKSHGGSPGPAASPGWQYPLVVPAGG